MLASVIRFDFDPLRATKNELPRTRFHPDSHVTLNSTLCRIPCAAPLRLGNFVEFVFKHFYPDVWDSHKYLRELSREGLDRTVRACEGITNA